LSLAQVAGLPSFEAARADFVAETIARVKESVGSDVAVIGFAGAPTTLLAYLLEGSGSRNFAEMRRAMLVEGVDEALEGLARSTRSYLAMQVEAGADAVQLFDSWA